MLRAFSHDLFGEQHGAAPARVLALPGWMRQRSDFRLVLDGFDAIALDLPGFGGASPEPAHASGAAGYATLVEPALDACAERVVVVGHSFGGRVAVHLAARHPERVHALVLAGTPRLVRPESSVRPSRGHRAARWLNRHGLVSDARMESRRRRSGSEDYRSVTGVMRDVLVAVVNEDYETQLDALECVVELVWGDDDDAAPLQGARRAERRLGDRARLTIVPGAGHLTPLSAPAALRDAITRHLD
jgi:pimeloyl-ACP methyl ester carboxylesterase